ncbi:nephrin-like isoform X2 [Limulus polyphemus]|uniref:Nephrin-like isoform X2 n=1 Tax=Limulus polyphemus TaxID=6850 RepID=A0ABM1TFR5_LIMPO|nr:nephrin-like isoform X2 [Limulus polyphemus]
MMTVKSSRWFLIVLTYWVLVERGRSQQQYFRTRPEDTSVTEGQTAELRCEVEHQAGSVQWSKDGFVLGFDRSIPGYARYSMIGNPKDGVHTLRIEKIILDDDAEYQCQVGPTVDNPAIRAKAHLTVLLPPTSIAIEGYKNGSTKEVSLDDTVSLDCTVAGGKPAPQIIWYRENRKLRQADIVSSDEKTEDERTTVVSSSKFQPTPEDNEVVYTCEASHAALDKPLRSSVKLSVLYPPGEPVIDGYLKGDTVRAGDPLTLICLSRGGNPLAELVWYKNDVKVDFSYTTSGQRSTNKHTFVVDHSDNNAIYRCEASSIVVPVPLKAEIKLRVQFSPAKVIVSGPREAKAGDTVTIQCTTERSSPAAELSWVVNGRPLTSENILTPHPDGGWVTSSNVTVTITAQDRYSKRFSCYSVNKALGDTVVESHVLSVLYPPDPPSIFGYTEGNSIRAGERLRLSCVSNGGNPPPDLTWFKEDQKVESSTSTAGNVSSAEVSIVTEESDNGAEYRCEATNAATSKPLYATTKLTVHFPPGGVTIRVKPENPKAGDSVTLICESGSSNPASIVTWWRDGFMIPGTTDAILDAPHGGKSVRNVLEVNVSSEDDKTVYKCQAAHEVLKQNVHNAVTLRVFYKPKFFTLPLETVDVVEGDSVVINLTVKANPEAVVYTWDKDGLPLPEESAGRISASGSVLNVTEASRADRGRYRCEAKNDFGATETVVILNVLYTATIVKVTELALVEPASNAYLQCIVDANPITSDIITWRSEAFDMNRTYHSLDNDRSFLTVYNVSKEDSGIFECVANNSIGDEAIGVANLVVKHKPTIHRSQHLLKAASEKGQTAKLVCRAEGAPNVTFTWSRGGSTIIETEEHEMDTYMLGLTSWESVLLLHHVENSDYGLYECVARNELGFDTVKIKLDLTSHPDPPVALKVVNFTSDSVLLRWVPAFDGGLIQSFRIRYKPTESLAYQYTDIFPPNSTTHVVSGLSPSTEYMFSVQSFNDLGFSDFMDDIVKVVTAHEIPGEKTQQGTAGSLERKADLPRIIVISVSVVGTILLVFNIVLVICFVRRRRKKRLGEGSEKSSSKTATIEMYAPSSNNGETTSSVSEKSEPYSDGQYSEEPHKPTLATYLIDEELDQEYQDNALPEQSNYMEDEPGHSALDGRPHLSRGHFQKRNGYLGNHHRLGDRESPRNIYQIDEAFPSNELRRNAYNKSIGEMIPVNYSRVPPPVPSRTAASSGTELAYIVPPDPTRSPPMLSTFNANTDYSTSVPDESYSGGLTVRDPLDNMV